MSDYKKWTKGQLTRRDVLRTGMLAAGAGLFGMRGMGMKTKRPFQAVSAVTRSRHWMPKQTGMSPVLTKWVDALPIPPVLQPTGVVNGVAQYAVSMTNFRQRVHRDLPPTPLWGYNGSWPGPTFEVRSGAPVEVLWQNNLPNQHLLDYAYDTLIHGADMGEPRVRSVVHLHGIKVLPDSDGYPEAWFTNGWGVTGPDFSRKAYHYPNDQPATNLWYHDHSLGITRLNVFTGLAGFYFIRDAFEDALNLPKGAYEIPLLIQDRLFNVNGTLQYPIDTTGTQQVWVPEFFGDVACINGKAWPYLEVEPRKYRFRMLNGSNARFYHFTLADAAGNAGPVFNQIGSDGGLLPAPVALTELLMAPAERYDVVIDFAGFEGRTLTLLNDAPAPFPGGDVNLPEIMQFRVTKKLAGADTSALPKTLAPITLIKPNQAVRERFIMLSEADRDSDGYPIIGELGGSPLNATASNPTGGARWDDPVTEDPKAGTTEIWNLVNITTDGHPIHIHLVQFQVLERRQLDLATYLATGKVQFTGAPIAPDANERPAWKDTVKALPAFDAAGNPAGLVTRVIAKFDLPSGTRVSPGQRFRYVLHCHILEHEDQEMMRPFDVVG